MVAAVLATTLAQLEMIARRREEEERRRAVDVERIRLAVAWGVELGSRP